ncbi:UDP-3-O-(3-hydroxymyristoyl)glucosamine N-acyltransferase [Thermodesulfovibrionales bacterium]|nr:UDP-3-O-(3-hydroxymyristoyl)glucosamine N-acyltransferase [Thermodesulfovibrionales bacterium]
MKLREIAEIINGEIAGDEEVEIAGVSGISDAKERDITYLASTKWLKRLKDSKASAVIVKESVAGIEKPQIKTKNPHYAFAKLLSFFYTKTSRHKGISEKAFISDNVIIGQNATIYPFAYIASGVKIGSETVIYPGVFIGENSIIGNDCLIYPNVTIREDITIGNRVIIHAGAVIGSDGFGYVFEDGIHHKIPQVGTVKVEDSVEIGANATIDRATTGNTLIGRGTKIDNLVQIGHNVNLGQNIILTAQVGVGGSSEIGDNVAIGGQAGVSDNVTIESGAMIGGKAGVIGNVSRGIYSGCPLMPHREWLRSSALFLKLPELNKKIRELEERIIQVENS